MQKERYWSNKVFLGTRIQDEQLIAKEQIKCLNDFWDLIKILLTFGPLLKNQEDLDLTTECPKNVT